MWRIISERIDITVFFNHPQNDSVPVGQSCPALCNPMDCSTPGFPVHHNFQSVFKFMSSSQWCHATVSSSIAPFSCLQSFPTSGSFPRSQLSASSGQSIGASASASVLQMNILPIWSFKWIYFLYGSNDRGLMMPFSWQTLQSFILKTCFVNLREHQVKQCWSLFIIDTWTKWTQLMKSEVDRNQVYNTYYSRVLHLGVHGFIFKRNGSH